MFLRQVFLLLFTFLFISCAFHLRALKMLSEFDKEKVFWTRKMNLKLVKFIESRPNIWNRKHPKYTSAVLKDQTYNEFAAKCGNEFTGQAVKDRWTNIRCTFANCLRKLKANAVKPECEAYKVNWHLWEPCQFLLKANKNLTTYEDPSNNSDLPESDNLLTPNESSDENLSDDQSNLNCNNIAESLLNVFRGVQNDAFGIDNSKYGKVGRMVSRTLSQMDSYEAAKVAKRIMDILLFYHEMSPINPNIIKCE